MDIARVCSENTTCTDCPAREACNTRKLFYNDGAYALATVCAFAEALGSYLAKGIPLDYISNELSECTMEMDRKRNEELRIHPNYSPK